MQNNDRVKIAIPERFYPVFGCHDSKIGFVENFSETGRLVTIRFEDGSRDVIKKEWLTVI